MRQVSKLIDPELVAEAEAYGEAWFLSLRDAMDKWTPRPRKTPTTPTKEK